MRSYIKQSFVRIVENFLNSTFLPVAEPFYGELRQQCLLSLWFCIQEINMKMQFLIHVYVNFPTQDKKESKNNIQVFFIFKMFK